MPKPMATRIDDQYTIEAIQIMRAARTEQLLAQDRQRRTGSNALRTRMSAWWETIVFKSTKEIVLP